VSGRRWLISGLAGAAVALLLARALAHIYTDYLWYASLGAADVWSAKYSSLFWLRLICAAVATLFVFANLYAVRQSVVSLVLPRRIGNIDIGEEVPRRNLTWTAAFLSVIIGLGFAWAQDDWSAFFAARVGQSFGESDPYFATDLGFFVYRLPFELSLFTWTMVMVLIVIGLVLLLYALTPSLRWEQGRLYISGYVRRHLTMLAGTLLLVLAWHYRLDMYTVLGNGSAIDGAFTSLDHRVGIPASLVLSLVMLGCGLVVLWAGWTGQLRLAFAALTGVIVAVVSARQVAPFIASRVRVERDPAVRERPYEATRKGYTLRAFAVDRIAQPRDSAGVSFTSLNDAAPFVPVWDEAALLSVNDQAAKGASLGWFTSDSGVLAVLPVRAGAAPVSYAASDAQENGMPLTLPEIDERARPEIHIVADSSAPAIVVPDTTGRIAAPRLEGSSVRLLQALSMQNLRLWIGDVPSPAPKVIARRTVRDRVTALAPLFELGDGVTPLWFADSLIWAVELYSTSRTYPLSRRQIIAGEERAYFQHAATALVNATTGRVLLIADSTLDPVASTWRARFPGLFARPGMLPQTLRRQLPPARESARAQASAFGRYGPRDENSVVRHLPDDLGPDSAIAGTPAPLLALPRMGTTAYVLPLLDNAERIDGLLVALGGPMHRTLWIPAGDEAPVWSEALDRLRAIDTTSGAALLVRGYVRTVPVGDHVLLVQPRYDWRRGSGSPRLLYVSAVLGDSERTARTLLALAGRLPDSTLAHSSVDFRTRARRLYEEMRRASANGDWSAFGRAFDALGVLVRSGGSPQ
jgi:uncharacterized membrane protein (UPF0182 family)